MVSGPVLGAVGTPGWMDGWGARPSGGIHSSREATVVHKPVQFCQEVVGKLPRRSPFPWFPGVPMRH